MIVSWYTSSVNSFTVTLKLTDDVPATFSDFAGTFTSIPLFKSASA